MRRDDSEIIEIFDTDGPLVGNGFDATRLGESEFRGAPTDDVDFEAAAETGGDVRRRRWVIPVGVTALVAVVAVGLTSGSDNPNVATPTTSGDSIAASPVTLATLPPTSADEGSTPSAASTPVGPAPRYVVDIPEGYALAGVSEGEWGTADVTYSQLWASPDASLRSGAWVAIMRVPAYDGDEQRLSLSENAYSLRIGSSTGIITIPATPEAVGSVALFRGDATLQVEGFGVSADDLTAIAEAIGSDPTEPFTAAGTPDVLSGFTKLVDTAGSWQSAEASGPMAQMYALEVEADRLLGRNNMLWITATPPNANYATVSRFLLDSITPFTAADGSIGIAGITNSQPPRAQAYWVDHDGWAVTVNIDGSLSEVIAAAETAHVADDAEWERNAKNDFVFEGAEPYSDQAPVTTLAFGSGETAEVAVDLSGVEPDIQNSWSVYTNISTTSDYGSYGGSAMASCDVPRIAVLTSLQRTYVMANVPAGTMGATLVVTHDGGASMAVPLAELKPEFRVLGGVLTFEQVGAFTAVLTAADGTVLATWPTPPGP